jgi:hypothetical protein
MGGREEEEGESGGKVDEGDLGEDERVDFGGRGMERGGQEWKSGREDGREVRSVEGVGRVDGEGKDWRGEEEVWDLKESPVGKRPDLPTR